MTTLTYKLGTERQAQFVTVAFLVTVIGIGFAAGVAYSGGSVKALAIGFGLTLLGYVPASHFLNKHNMILQWPVLRAKHPTATPTGDTLTTDTKGVSPVMATLLMLAITVTLAVVVFLLVSEIGK